MSVRPAHLSMPRSTPACVDVEEALQRILDDGHDKAAIWGAGDHTRRSLGALFESPIEITEVIDDAERLQGRRLLGWRIRSVSDFLSESEATAVLISSNHAPHIDRMWAQRERFEAVGKTLYRLNAAADAPAGDLCLPPVLAVTMPKSGTWLLVRLLTLLGFDAYRGQSALYRLSDRRMRSGTDTESLADASPIDAEILFELLPAGQVTTLHVPGVVNRAVMDRFVSTGQCKVVLLVRDPRDIVVARAHFWKHPQNARHATLQGLTIQDVMDRVIRGDGASFSGISQLVASYRSLCDSPHVHVIRFEEIVRAARAPRDPAAIEPVRKLAEHCGIPGLPDARMRAVLSKLEIRPYPGRSSVTDEWRTEFGDSQKSLFAELASDALSTLGYK